MSERLLFKIPHSSHLMPKGVFCSLRTDKGSLRWIIESWLQKTIAAAAIARYRTQHNFYNTVFLRILTTFIFKTWYLLQDIH